ncbi:hypothetical protein [Planktothricoides raciborskii]|uniref:hypothetical protein n=1 Tax=Planktothricoides raciborskii TaxID=132608 RepID=UPI0016871736|nr:hypothetical protein [Planktothricoides raciborskii]
MNPRNRVSLDHLCHPTEVLIETRFLFGWQRQCDRPFAPPQKPGFFRPSLSPHQRAHRNPVSCLLICVRAKHDRI